MKNNSRQDRIPGYLYALDGLRAVSLLLIVMFHTWQQSWISYHWKPAGMTHYLFNLETLQRCGYVAIDSFFVLSGFCLFYPIARDMFGESKFGGWKSFFIKRARRIYPSYLLMLLIMLFVPKLAYGCDMRNFTEVVKHYLTHILFIHTWNAKTLGSTISTAWTMGIECQFYVIFPLLCIPFRKKPVATFAGMVIFSLGLRLFMLSYKDIGAMVMQAATPAYFDVFGFGMIAAYFVVYARNNARSLMDKLKPFMTLISALCLFLAVCYMYWLNRAQFPDGFSKDVYFRFLYRGIFAALIAGFIFTACFSYSFWEKKICGNKLWIFLSAISYTVYLWHQNIYIFLKNTNLMGAVTERPMDDRSAMWRMTLICLAASVIIGWLVTNYIEAPIVKYGFKGAFDKLLTRLQFKEEKKTTKRVHSKKR
ncbi:MAG: acyltransferase family protein [Candidatus Ornithomonoglobus sp.]